MLKGIVPVLREQHIGKVISGVFLLFALAALADVVEQPFSNGVIRFLNAHTTQSPLSERTVPGLVVTLKSIDVALYSFLAWMSYHWLGRKRREEPHV